MPIYIRHLMVCESLSVKRIRFN